MTGQTPGNLLERKIIVKTNNRSSHKVSTSWAAYH